MAATTTHFILATAGHVDHGKSALVRALTGIDPDRLPEEKARGITIELGFAHLILPHPAGPSCEYALGVVDVPGHEDFVKNMVAGVGSIDLALLVVAADDGWMPQTEEHLQILDYFGVTHAIVALTKCDLVPDFGPVREAVRAKLADSPFATAPILPTSVATGDGLEELKTALAQVLSEVPLSRDQGQPRLPIDRAFSLPGAGSIVTGTLSGGSLVAGQSIIIQPTGKSARIRRLQNHGVDVAKALPGMRAALNIPEAPLASQASDGVARGQIVTLPELGGPTRTIDVELRRSGRNLKTRRGTARALKDGARIRLHHGSSNVAAKLILRAPLHAGERALAQLRLEAPLFVLAGDRFILRDWGEQTTLAGGRILDLDTSARRFRLEPQQRLLRERALQPADANTWILTLLDRDHLCARSQLGARTRFGMDDIAASMKQLAESGLLIDLGVCVAQPDWWVAARARALSRVRQHHLDHPEQMGLLLSDLRSALSVEFKEPLAFEGLMAELCRSDLSRDHATIRERTHTPALPLPLQAAAARLRAQLGAHLLDPPSREKLAPDASSQQALRFLLDTGEAMSAGPELVLLTTAMARARQLIRQHIRKHGPATASELRVALGTNRRVIIPLLEQFDRDGLTIREGDRRGLR